MSRDISHREVRQIIRFGSLAVILMLLVSCCVGLLVPFDVDLQSTYQGSVGTALILDTLGNKKPLDNTRQRKLAVGDMIRAEAGSTVEVEIIDDMQAYAYLMGPVEWNLDLATRRATLVEHAIGASRRYEVVIHQNYGSAVYDFSQSKVLLEDLNLSIQFPDKALVPTTNCFQATALSENSPSTVVSIPCAEDVTPTPEPTPLSLP